MFNSSAPSVTGATAPSDQPGSDQQRHDQPRPEQAPCDERFRADRYVQQVELRLQRYLDGQRDRWQGRYPQLTDGFDAIESFVLSGGKRMRPRFAFWGHRAAGGEPDDPRLVDLGAAIELFHAFALIHDDVMDDSGMRRHQPTVHHRFSVLHHRRGWAGEQRRVGESFAILLGDLAFAYSNDLLAGLPPAVVELFDTTRIELHIGQYLDLICATGDGDFASVALDVARFKTAKYSVERPLHLGSALAGCDALARLAPSWSDYGLAVGEAFQHRDDLLGVFGDTAVTGKPVGDDLRAGKATMLLRRAQQAPGAACIEPLGRVGSPGFSDADVAVVARFMRDCGAVACVEERIRALIEEAGRGLAAAPLDAATRHGLHRMAADAAWRTT